MRKFLPGDRALFLSLQRAFYASPAVLSPVPDAYFDRNFDELMRSDVYMEGYLLEDGGAPAGYALVSKSWSPEAAGPVAWIEELYILPEFQGRGLGSAFLQAFERDSAGRYARIRLEVERENDGASRLYERLGFDRLAYDQLYKDF
ncbi:MAG: GNAT family N-acetyltransferase [Oscillospiraceae bacterium]|nr:GNAT family N-acetyltransferase [Oscillospiraceae bacterium]